MLYLHCGWPKTGTTSLQAALVEHRDLLADAGVVYPRKWTREGDDSHKLLATNGGPDAAIGELETFLERHADRDVLLSNEVLSLDLFKGEIREVLVNLVTAARQVMPVRCVWVLRRFDDVVHSACVHRMTFGLKAPTPECIAGLDPGRLFAGMNAVGNAADEVLYIRYDSSGRYQAGVLDALGIPKPAADTVWRDLMAMPRRNVGASHKEAAALANLEAISTKCGVPLDRSRLRELFAAGNFRFANDVRCNLLDAALRQGLHEKALAAAQECGIQAYERFFGDAKINPSSTPPSDAPNPLSEDDLQRLATELRRTSPV